MIRHSLLIVGLSTLLVPCLLDAQQAELRFHHLSIEDGLSQSTVQSVLQDHQGFVWFGTQDGLNRYDGYEIIEYRPDHDDSLSLSHEDVRVIYEDSEETLWIGTQAGGLNRYNRDLDAFEHFMGVPDDWRTLSANSVWTLLEDSRGDFWVGTYHGLNLMDRSDGSVRRYFFDPGDRSSLSSNEITVLMEDRSGRIWVGTSNGLNRLESAEEGHFRRITSDSDPELDNSFIWAVYEDSDGGLWVGTEENGLFYTPPGEEVFINYIRQMPDPYRLTDRTVRSIEEDNQGRLWIGTGGGGLNLYDREKGRMTVHQIDRQNPNSLTSNGLIHLYRSRDGILWVGTFNGGVNYYDPVSNRFGHYESSPVDPNSLSSNMVMAFLQDRAGRIWVGTDRGGLNLFDPLSGRFEHYRHDPESVNSLSSDAVLALHETERGIWIGTYEGGVDLFDPDRESFRNFRSDPADPNTLSSNHIFEITETADGSLWFGTNRGGLNRLPPGGDSFERFMANPGDPADPTTINNDDVRAIYEDSRGDLWIGNYANLNLIHYDRDDGRFSFIDINEGKEHYSSVVQAIHEDSSGRLWLGTRGGGLMLLDPVSRQTRSYTIRDGLPNNVIHDILEDDNGALWLSTNNGLVRFEPDSGTIKTYRIADGLQSNEFIPKSAYRDRDGLLYFGGVNGFNRFHPDSIRVDSLVPPLVLTDFQIFNRPVEIGGDSPLQKHISRTERLVLPHDAHVITFGYSMLDFNALKANQFAYRLQGFEEQWNFVGSQRRATYTNLNPGEYTFRVIAANSDGIWNEDGIELSLVITPPFWQTGLFYLLLAVLIGGIVTLLFQMRVYAIRRQNRRLARIIHDRTDELKKANETKDRFFSIIAHDLNNIVAGILGLSELLKDSVERKEENEVKEYTDYLHQTSGQLAAMLRNLLDWARSQTGKIEYRPRQFRISERVDEVIMQERGKAVNKQITLVSTTVPELSVYADPDMIAVVLRNLVHNALKFTEPGGQVEIFAIPEGEMVAVSVRDNGIGMDEQMVAKIFSDQVNLSTKGTADERGTGLGLSLCRDFIDKNRGLIKARSKVGEGTVITFTLPANSLAVGAGEIRSDLVGELAVSAEIN